MDSDVKALNKCCNFVQVDWPNFIPVMTDTDAVYFPNATYSENTNYLASVDIQRVRVKTYLE